MMKKNNITCKKSINGLFFKTYFQPLFFNRINIIVNNQFLKLFVEKNSDFFIINKLAKTYLNNDIFALTKIYSLGAPFVLVTAGIHAREHLSCDFLCLLIKRLTKMKPLPYNISFVPLVNPDGAELVINGLKNVDETKKEKLIKINGGNSDFSLFKANALGVDLNNNFDGGWDKKFTDKSSPSSSGYYGSCPLSEIESKALVRWTQILHPAMTISYHLKGEEIYFDYFQEGQRKARDEKIAQIFSKSTTYKIKPTQHISSGGFKDFCVQKLKIPSLTIELGRDDFSHPYPQTQLPDILLKNRHFFSDIESSLKLLII